MTLSENLRILRKNAGLTQEQVAAAVSIKRGTYAYYEVDKCAPKIETLKALARLYNISVDELIGNTVDNSVAQSTAKGNVENPLSAETLSDLTPFEQSVVLRIRMMSKKDKAELADYLDIK